MIENIFEKQEPASFPPLFTGEAVTGTTDPFDKACTQAMIGCDAGLLVHNVTPDQLRAAIVFAPEASLENAMSAFVACGVGFQNALGALAPPEVAVHLGWQGQIYINGGLAGRLRVAASDTDPDAVPDWLVVGLEIDLLPPKDVEAGDNPNQTSLVMEGCGDVSPIKILESWSRYTLVWINETDTDGNRPLHELWRGLLKDIGNDITLELGPETLSGTFLGVDENFGGLLRTGSETRLLSLTKCLQTGDI